MSFLVVRGEIPSELEDGIIYVNPEISRAHHLCACGCRSRVLTPLNPDEWRLSGPDDKPSMQPSIGNWNLNCQSHYFIKRGRVIWMPKWDAERIAEGRRREQKPYLESRWWNSLRNSILSLARKMFRDR